MNSLDASLAIALLALVAVACTAAIAAKASLYAQGMSLQLQEQKAIAESEFALTHCPPQGIAECSGERVRANEVASNASVFSFAEAANRRGSGLCVRRLVLAGGGVKIAEFCGAVQ